MKKILLVEDDPEVTSLFRLHFNKQLYSLSSYDTGNAALQQIIEEKFDLLILDISLPDMNGLELCKTFRESNQQTPVMMLTSRGNESDKVLALELGADDYVTKPFGVLEFMARTKALIRRSNNIQTEKPDENNCIFYKDLVVDIDKKKASVKGKRLELTNKEFDLLLLFATHPGKIFSRHELLDLIWGITYSGYELTITSHINRLRIKIESDFHYPEYILTVWGRGYRFPE